MNMNLLQKIEQKQTEKLLGEKSIPDFAPGDTVRVNVRIKEGSRERIQAYEGLVVARRNAGVNSSFTVRKISLGEGVERVFPLYSPKVESVVVVRRGDVRRAKLYYLRDRRGKSARISERTTGHGMEDGREMTAEAVEAKSEAKAKKAAAK
jgi:large subunit ribosomal protein L19